MNLANLATVLAAASLAWGGEDTPTATLERQLQSEPTALLAKAALEQGDAKRGARTFYQPALTCVSCHALAGNGPNLGPDLGTLGSKLSAGAIIESLLYPSKSIRKGYETITIITHEGQVISGLLAEETPEKLVVRDVTREGASRTVPRVALAERKDQGLSLMPPGLVNGLHGRQEFLDLVKFLAEVARDGPARALALKPRPEELAPPPVPEYEKSIDHARLIAGLGPESRQRGEAIYVRVCANCHGTLDQPGSLPTAPRFAAAPFKGGSDPYSLYRVLTYGAGQMTAQNWMVPKQKYDVVHYLRETFLKEHNPSRYQPIDPSYLASLPKGTSTGPDPVVLEPWSAMNHGPVLSGTYEIGREGPNLAYKGIAIRLDPGPGGIARGRAWAVYEHDTLRYAGAWTGEGFIDWNGISFNGRHQVHPRTVGHVHISNPNEPGWANPVDGSWDDPRLRGRDGIAYGPLPRSWARFEGRYQHGDQTVLSYRVGDADVLEMAGLESTAGPGPRPVFTRTLEIGPSSHALSMLVGPEWVAAEVLGPGGTLARREGRIVLNLPPSQSTRRVKVLMSRDGPEIVRAAARTSPPPESPRPLTRGGPQLWPETLKTMLVRGDDQGAFALDVLTDPTANPWSCQMRFTGLDFFEGGACAALCTWDGDVWTVDGLNRTDGQLEWKRIAAGMFQPLGLRIVGGQIYVGCRDQIVRLLDQDGNDEIDLYENFNSDHQVTEHFHEFAMGLQTDPEGNFYYAKAARHALPAVVPQHGTLLRVSKDGSRTEILATGFRAPNGVCLNSDGTFFLTDQEGHWVPKNRINWVKPGGFYGNMFGYHDVTDPSDAAMEPPVCWITNALDRSPAELIRVESDAWAPLRGALLNLSYGYGRIFVVPHEVVDGVVQGGMATLPIPASPTGLVRGRFHPVDGQLYLCGMYAWAGSATQPGGFYRVRYTGQPIAVLIGLHARKWGLELVFSEPLGRSSAADVARYSVKTWSLKRTANYGSPHFDERPLSITRAVVSEDGRRVSLHIPEIRPTWGMEVRYTLQSPSGQPIEGVAHNTIHKLGKD